VNVKVGVRVRVSVGVRVGVGMGMSVPHADTLKATSNKNRLGNVRFIGSVLSSSTSSGGSRSLT
jgi:hypothetical protein